MADFKEIYDAADIYLLSNEKKKVKQGYVSVQTEDSQLLILTQFCSSNYKDIISAMHYLIRNFSDKKNKTTKTI